MTASAQSGRSASWSIVQSNFRVRPEALVIGRVFRDLAPSTMVVQIIKGESHDLLRRTRCITTNGIAQLLRSGWYSKVHVKSMQSHHIRMLLSSRKAVLSKCVDLENEVRGLFKVFGIKLPPKLGHGAFDPKVRPVIETDEMLSHALLPLLDARLVLYHSFRELDNRTRHLAHGDPVCLRLMSVPGVGFVTALTFKAGVDDPHRFKRSRTVGAHFGLTPRRFQSGEMDIEGHISKCGDADVRATLYTAANALLTRSSRWSSLKAWGMKLAKTRGHRRAVIAVARKLAVILHRVWIDDTQFRWGTEGARS